MKCAFNIIASIAIGVIVLIAPVNLSAQTSPTTAPQSPASVEKTRAAIADGLKFLVSQQNADGSFQVAGTKLQTSAAALLAFLSAGDVPDNGRYGDAVRRVTEFLLRQTPGDRYFGRVDGSRMRGHAIVTLALCEVYGVETDEATRIRLRATVKDAIAVILAAQNLTSGDASGGWSADAGGKTSDAGTTFWCLLALRAAGQIGFDLPRKNMDRAAASLTSNTLDRSIEKMLWDQIVGGQAVDISPLLIAQSSNGSWIEQQQPNTLTATTAMNVLVIAMNDEILPIWSAR